MKRIQQRREYANMTRAQLGVKAGVSERTVFNLETKVKQRKTGVNHRKALARALSVPVETLFDKDGYALEAK